MTDAGRSNDIWLWIGGVGAVLAATCIFTPLLAIALAAVGAGGLAVYLNMVLVPLLLFFIVVFAVGVLFKLKNKRIGPAET